MAYPGLLLTIALLSCGPDCGAFAQENESIAEQRAAALKWLIRATSEDPHDAVNGVLLYTFASNLAGSQADQRLLDVTQERLEHIVDSERIDVDEGTLLQAAALVHASPARTSKLAASLRSAWKVVGTEIFVSPSRPAHSPVDEVNRLMTVAMLRSAEISSEVQLQTVARLYRDRYSMADVARPEEYRAVLYYAAHVVFAISDFGRRRALRPAQVQAEVRVIERALDSDEIRRDNDLWPELFVALGIVRGCQHAARRAHLRNLLAGQSADGSWSPVTLPESSRLHTTTVMYFALLSDAQCSAAQEDARSRLP
jgi:hypothetical protein